MLYGSAVFVRKEEQWHSCIYCNELGRKALLSIDVLGLTRKFHDAALKEVSLGY